MLSRVAESLYWTSRYIERAEDVTRLLDVNFHALLDTPAAEHRASWQQLVEIAGNEELFHETYPEFTARSVSEFLLWHPENPNAVTTCIEQAREDARSVRDLITSEMWEHINKLYFLVRDADRTSILAGPHEFFRRVREGSHAFLGVTTATMPHGEGYQFVQLGTHLERADKTVRIVDVKYATIDTAPESPAAAALRLMALLKSCSAFEAFRKEQSSHLDAVPVAEFLLLDRLFPRAVLFCFERCLDALGAISSSADGPHHTLGRLCAELSYSRIEELLARPLHSYLAELLRGVNRAGDEIASAYFSTQVLAPLPDAQHAQQQQQQQQQQ
jgi:uncharacterized alpha-E superfamily protein